MIERFLKHVTKHQDGHWYWNGCLDKDGYGVSRDITGKKRAAHIVSFMLFRQYDPSLNVLHKCDIRRCVNPDCLFQGTQKDNVRDCVAKGRHRNQLKTHCAKGHAFTPENTIERRSKGGKLWRRCKTCRLSDSVLHNS